MATKVFLTAEFPNADSTQQPAIGIDGDEYGSLGSRLARTTAGAGAVSGTVSTVAGPTAGVPYGQNFTTLPLAADVTISSLMTFNIWGLENNMSANAGPHIKVWRLAKDGTMTLIVSSEEGVEFGTSSSVHNWTATPTSTACLKGDCLVIQFLANDVGTMGTGFTASLRYSGATNAADGDSYVSFGETITFQSYPTTVKTLYATAVASPVSVSGESTLVLDTSAPTNTALTAASANGPTTLYPNTGGNRYTWYSGTLAADLAITAPVKMHLDVTESNASANAYAVGELWYCDADGTNAVQVATSGQYGNGSPNGVEMSTGGGSFLMMMAGTATVPAGKRLRLVVKFIDANFADVAQTMATGFTLTLNTNATAATRLEFADTFAFGSALADNAAAADSLSRSTSPSTRTLSDNTAASDSLTRGVGKTAALADNSAAADSLVRGAATRARSLADNAAAADTLAEQNVRARALGDSQAATDALTRALISARTLSDSQAAADSLARSAIGFTRSLSDNAAAADVLTPSTTQRLTRTLSDSQAASDSLARTSLAQPRVLTDAAAALDTLSRALALSRTLADNAAAADTLIRSAPRARTLADNAAAADTLTRTPTEQLFPDAILSSTNMTGTVATVQDDPDSPDGVWMTATASTSDSVLYVSFPTPRVLLARGTNRQQFRIRIRRAP